MIKYPLEWCYSAAKGISSTSLLILGDTMGSNGKNKEEYKTWPSSCLLRMDAYEGQRIIAPGKSVRGDASEHVHGSMMPNLNGKNKRKYLRVSAVARMNTACTYFNETK